MDSRVRGLGEVGVLLEDDGAPVFDDDPAMGESVMWTH